MLFSQYNDNPAKYRLAVHPAAQWIRDQLFQRSLTPSALGKERVVFTAGGNAAGKSAAISFSGASSHSTAAVLDSTFSNYEHADRLVEHATSARKRVTILYVNRPLGKALTAMLDRAKTEGRVVTLNQLIRSQIGAAKTVRGLWNKFSKDPYFAFRFFDNSPDGFTEGGVDVAKPAAYTESRKTLDEILETEYHAGRITGETYRRVRGRGEPAVRRNRGGDDRSRNEPPAGTEER